MTAPSEYVPPTYREVKLPTAMNPLGSVWVPTCEFCGALVLDQVGHDAWHAQLWVALRS